MPNIAQIRRISNTSSLEQQSTIIQPRFTMVSSSGSSANNSGMSMFRYQSRETSMLNRLNPATTNNSNAAAAHIQQQQSPKGVNSNLSSSNLDHQTQ